MNRNHGRGRAGAGRGLWPSLGVGALALTMGACDTDGLVQLNDPDLITRPIIEDTANIGELRNGVLFEFNRAYGGVASNSDEPGQVVYSGMLADELVASSTFTTHREVDARATDPTNSSADNTFFYLQRARNLAEQVAAAYASSPRANSADHAWMVNVSGFSYVMFAENYCSGVPISIATLAGQTTYSPPLTTDSLLNRAIARFDAAASIAQGAGASGTTQLNAARVGKARALLNLGRYADAATAAAAVPTDFRFVADLSASGSGQNNGTWYYINSAKRMSPWSGEGGNGLRFFARGATGNTIDPRVGIDSLGFGLGTNVPQYGIRKYADRGADIPIATGIEARLIQAEALLNKGNSTTYLAPLNELRTTIGLAALTDPGTPKARVKQFFDERALWLYLTSHRLGDLRRMIRQYGFQANEVFPTGQTVAGQTYGTAVNLPVPFAEQNNPQFPGGCLNRDA